MPSVRGLSRTLHGLDGRVPVRIRRGVHEVRRRVAGAGRASVVTVVVAVSDADSGSVDACLDSLRSQSHRDLRVLVIPYGPCLRAVEVARRHASEDWRITLPGAPAGTRGGARNRGASLARGEYLAFVDPRDVVPPTGLAALVAALDETGSQFAVGAVKETFVGARTVEAQRDPVHERRRLGTTIGEFPLAVTDVSDENRLFRRSFWTGARLAYPEGTREGRPFVALHAFAQDATFDLLEDVTYHRGRRTIGTPLGAVRNAMDELATWLADQSQTLELLDTLDNAALHDAWSSVVCDATVVPFLDDAERADPEQWQALRQFLEPLQEGMSAEAWRMVRAQSRVKVWLAVADRRAELEELVADQWFTSGNRRTEVVDGRVFAKLPFYQDPAVGVPDECYVMDESETRLNVHLRAVRWCEDHRLELDVFAFIDFVGYEDETPHIEVALVDADGRRTAPLAVRHRVDPEVNTVAAHRYQDYARGAATVVVDAAELSRLAEASPPPTGAEAVDSVVGLWRLDVRLSARGLTRQGTVTHRDRRGSAGMLGGAVFAPRSCGEFRVNVVPDLTHGVLLTALREQEVELVTSSTSQRVWEGTLRTSTGGLKSLRVSHPDGPRVERPLTENGDGTLGFRLKLPAARRGSDPRAAWVVRAVDRDGTAHPVAFPAGAADRWLSGPSPLAVQPSGLGNCELVEAPDAAVLEAVDLEGGQLRVRGRLLGEAAESCTVHLLSRRLRVSVPASIVDGRSFEAVVPLRADEWGLGTAPVPAGVYDLAVDGPGGPCRLLLTDAYVDGLLESQSDDDFRMTRVRAFRGPRVRLARPLREDERGALAQQRLQDEYAGDQHALERSAVYLQSYDGGSATDSQRALHDELRRTRPELTLYWAVNDHSVQVPEGGVPVLMESREWHRVLATARFLCSNVDLPRWFDKRPEQRFLQTFHGYPAKSMGIRMWEAKQFTPRRIERELDRTSRDWDLILTPTPEMDEYYRVEYRYDGEIENAGYPRDDALLASAADEVRRATRERLGVRPDQTVVLYAPTWRDDLATNWRSAPIVAHLDLESASRALGDDFVLLMRGHRFHSKGAERSERTARLVDVTDYPEINDLILASDVAVLDYSSLRFDFALTRRPMLFLVPDLHTYTGGIRGFLYDFEDSAPGPLLQHADQVVEQLRDLDAVRARHAEVYQRFHDTYNYLQDGHAAERVVERFFR